MPDGTPSIRPELQPVQFLSVHACIRFYKCCQFFYALLCSSSDALAVDSLTWRTTGSLIGRLKDALPTCLHNRHLTGAEACVEEVVYSGVQQMRISDGATCSPSSLLKNALSGSLSNKASPSSICSHFQAAAQTCSSDAPTQRCKHSTGPGIIF